LLLATVSAVCSSAAAAIEGPEVPTVRDQSLTTDPSPATSVTGDEGERNVGT
jgi:hypothetical protein